MRFFKCVIATLIIHDERTYDLIYFDKKRTRFNHTYSGKNLYNDFLPISPYEEFTPLEVKI